jgi:hypothetical protein
MTRDLREIQTRISRFVTQSSRSVPIELFEEIPRVFADLKQRLSKSKSTISRVTAILNSRNEDELLNEVRSMKQQSVSLQDFLKEVSVLMNVDSLKKCLRQILDMKSQLEEFRARERQICDLLGVETLSKALSTISRISETNKLVKRLGFILKIEGASEISEKIGKLVEIEQLLGTQLKSVSPRTVSNWLTSITEFQERNDRIMQILQVNSSSEIESKLDAIVEADLEFKALQSALKLNQGAQRIRELQQMEEICSRVCQTLDLRNFSEINETLADLVRANAAMNELEGQIMVSVSVLSPDLILPKISELSNRLSQSSEIIDSVSIALGVKDPAQIVRRIKSLLKLRAGVKEALKLIGSPNLLQGIADLQSQIEALNDYVHSTCEKLKLTDPNEIDASLDSLLRNQALIDSLNRKFPPSYESVSFEQSFEELLKERYRLLKLGSLFECQGVENIERAVQKLQDDLSTASRLFSKLISTISRTDVTIIFPVDDAGQARLSKLIEDQKRIVDADRARIELILNRALSFGHRGSDVGEAVDAIVEACCEAEKEKSHDELMRVRATSEKQKRKLERAIDDLNQKLADGKQKEIGLENELMKEQRIHRELIFLIGGQRFDRDFLNQTLDSDELRAIRAAKSGR